MSPEQISQQEPADKRGNSAQDIDTVSAAAQRSEEMSDVMLPDLVTGQAPSFRAPAPPPAPLAAARVPGPMALLPGAKVDDFEIVRMLGKGAFGQVYLARQLSLDRLVALKISANRGSEGRTMARLEHRHIVQVFSEKVEPEFNQRLLCMQLVPGLGLERLIAALHPRPPGAIDQQSEDWTGEKLLFIIDQSASMPATLDPSALHDRDALARMDAVEATAWFGERLAEALDFAHRHGVLHRDIKPANILVNSYGQPLLADFNISSQPVGSTDGEDMFGGTFAYMAPEHLDAFNPAEKDLGPEAVTAQSDLFSLGLVLRQMLSGGLGFTLPGRKGAMIATLHEMARDRRQARAECGSGPPGARQVLERTISRCLAPLPQDRFASGAELAEQLDGCRRLRQAERHLPPPSRIGGPALRRPFLWLIILVVLPQLLGSAVNIIYNQAQIVTILSESQQEVFRRVVLGYNVVVYPAAVIMFILALRPVWRCWTKLERGESIAEGEVETARRQALQLPSTVAVLTAVGWFPGGILFPLLIHFMASPLPPKIWVYFLVSFFMSGLIALAYSLCGVQFVVLRSIYPRMWRNVRSYSDTARIELAPMNARLWYIFVLAGSIPLLAAILTLSLADESASYRGLVIAMIILGWIGFEVSRTVVRDLSQVISALTGSRS